MRIFLLALFIIFACCPFEAQAADKDAEYLALVDAAIAAPDTAKWCDIRDMYPDTSFYRALGNPAVPQKAEEAGKRMILDKSQESVEKFKRFSREHFGNLGAHRYAAYLYKWNRELIREGMDGPLPDFGKGIDYIDNKLEKKAAKALLDCAVATGDGRTPATGFKVITADEQRIIIEQYFRVDATEARMSRDGERVNSIVKVQIPDGAAVDINFLLDNRMVQRLKETSGNP
jgi:hypothetical protein